MPYPSEWAFIRGWSDTLLLRLHRLIEDQGLIYLKVIWDSFFVNFPRRQTALMFDSLTIFFGRLNLLKSPFKGLRYSI